MKKKYTKHEGFTLIELLTVVAIIAALVGILSVAQRKVKIVSLNLRQKAAFHAGEISLELYSKDFGEYPDSALVASDGLSAAPYVTGAQRMAEAFFGRDDRGFHPKTKWHPSLDAAAPAPGPNLYDATVTLKDRKVSYFERKRAGFYAIADLWSGGAGGSSIFLGVSSAAAGDNKTQVSPVFTDVFERNEVTINGESEKVGMPILYFKADPTKKFRTVNPAVPADYVNWVYNFNDNLPILQLPWLRDPAVVTDGLTVHYKDPQDAAKSNAQVFYELITARQDGNFYKPANQNTFLLISAGYDGIYGTKDDLTNFDD
jgi:prepilin-type N-terminal cleavage/methylation domain-containing protein